MDFSDNPSFWSGHSIRPTVFEGFSPYSPEPQFQRRKQPPETPVKMFSYSSSTTAPKVVEIPIHFVGSEPFPSQSDSRSDSALKIQKVFRGFLVRRSMKRIIAIRRDVDEIEKRILQQQSEILESIRRDERERLRVNEMLMALLLKLDSVLGVDSGVRDCRRAVAKKAIALQERIDFIVSAVDQSDSQILDESQQNAEAVVQALESATADDSQNSVECSGGQIEESDVAYLDHASYKEGSEDLVADNCERIEEENRTQESVDEIRKEKESGDHSGVRVDDENCMDKEVENFVMIEADMGTRDEEEKEHSVEKEPREESCHDDMPVERREEITETSQMETLTEGCEKVNDASVNHVEDKREEEREKTSDNKRNQELLERLIKDNQKMMNMMSQLCERNEMQMKLLNSLTNRVELLEKAYVCHIFRKKKGRLSQ